VLLLAMVVLVERTVRLEVLALMHPGRVVTAVEEPVVLQDMQLQRTLIQLLLQTTVQFQVHKDN
jgi:hypothetical protein